MSQQDIQSLLQEYVSRGFSLCFYGAKKKHPEGAKGREWNVNPQKLDEYHSGENVGIILGTEISPGKHLIDVDFDWAEGLPLVKRLLPATGFGFGRLSRPLSHAFYTTTTPLAIVAYDDIDNKPLVELRGTKKDGSIGHQTMAPPSIHPSGELIELRDHGDIAHRDEIGRRVLLYAIACMLFKHIGHRGVTHDVRLAIAGYLLKLGLMEPDVKDVGVALTEVTGNDSHDFVTALGSVSDRVKRNQSVPGYQTLIRILGHQGSQILGRIRSWTGDGNDFIHGSNGKVNRDAPANIQMAFEKLDVRLSFDEFSQKKMIQYGRYDGVVNDTIANRIRFAMNETYHFLPGKDLYYDLLHDIATQNGYHPVREYLSNLTWDGVERIDRWLIDYAQAKDTRLIRAFCAIVLIAAVRRVRFPGCKFDEMLVLISAKQGTNKSSAIRALCPNEDWFSDDLPLSVEAKEVIERTGGKWLIEATELQGFSAKDDTHLKAMLSRQKDGPARMAYAREPIEAWRQWILIGTTNTHLFLRDKTGNRRFWPVEIGRFDVDRLKADRDQIWAEASQREERGESIHLDESLWGIAEGEQDEARISDPWEEIIEQVIESAGNKDRVPLSDIWMALGMQPHLMTMRESTRVASIMQRHGYNKKTRVRPVRGADPVWCWVKSREEQEEFTMREDDGN